MATTAAARWLWYALYGAWLAAMMVGILRLRRQGCHVVCFTLPSLA